MKGIKVVIGLLFLIAIGPYYIYSQADEQELKLVFIERFTQFIDWNSNQLSDIEDVSKEFVIGTTGDSEYAEILHSFFSGRKLKGKPVKIITAQNKEDYLKCNLLHVSDMDDKKLNTLVETVSRLPILTISDREEYSESGIQITICRQGEHLGFCINETALAGSGLKANYLLLESARIINPVLKERP
ncbi:MAG: YfiR family protein [Candidatus Cloacimonetes bacterium]|nr:YfiR family protein [Candidatus Cloacimonadota bacterium]